MQGRLRNMTSIYITSGDRILMLYRIGSRVVAPSWCGIGGHFEREELNDAKAAALRELKEEINLEEQDLKNLELRYVTLRNKNGEIRQNYYFFAELAEKARIPDVCDEGILEWIPLKKVLDKIMPYTAKYVLEHYITQGQKDDVLYCGTALESGVVFHPLEEFGAN